MPPHTRPAEQNGARQSGGGTTCASKCPTTGLQFWSAAAAAAETVNISAPIEQNAIRINIVLVLSLKTIPYTLISAIARQTGSPRYRTASDAVVIGRGS